MKSARKTGRFNARAPRAAAAKAATAQPYKVSRSATPQRNARSRRLMAGSKGVSRVLNPLTLQSYSVLSGRVWIFRPRRNGRPAK